MGAKGSKRASASSASSRQPAASEGMPSARPYVDESAFKFIPDKFTSIEQVQDALQEGGLESVNLIVGIDFTKSNEWTGKYSFNGHSLHATGLGYPNPYESALTIIGKTLSRFDEDNLIPAYGFGDVSTHDSGVFSFNERNRPCQGFEEVVEKYKEIVPHVKLSGPTSFAPIIEMAVRTVEENHGQYHVLLIIADGQVTRGADIPYGMNSTQEQATINAIVAASGYSLSIILVGIGDGPWKGMKAFDDKIPERKFDNFQFVNYSQIMKDTKSSEEQKAAKFAVAALMEIPTQFRACQYYQLVGKKVGRMPPIIPLDPPTSHLYSKQSSGSIASYGNDSRALGGSIASHDSFSRSMPREISPGSFASVDYAGDPGSNPRMPSSNDFRSQSMMPFRKGSIGPGMDDQYGGMENGGATASDNLLCPICFANPRNMAFQCGHQACNSCGQQLTLCHICRTPIVTKIKLYG